MNLKKVVISSHLEEVNRLTKTCLERKGTTLIQTSKNSVFLVLGEIIDGCMVGLGNLICIYQTEGNDCTSEMRG